MAYQDRTTSWDSREDSEQFDAGDHDRDNDDFRDDEIATGTVAK